MRFENIPADILSVRVKAVQDSYVFDSEVDVLNIASALMEPDVFELRLKDKVVQVKTVNRYDTKLLGDELLRGASHLVRLQNPAADGSVDLMIATFAGDTLEMGLLEIGVDESAEAALNRAEHRSADRSISGEKLYKHLSNVFSYRHGDEDYFFMFCGAALNGELTEAESKIEEKSAQTESPNPGNSFCVVGDDLRFVATPKVIPEDVEVFVVSRLTSAKNYRDRSLCLAKGKLSFLDYTNTGRAGLLARAQLARLTQETSSYLKKWDVYGNEEGEMLLRNARHFGIIGFDGKVQNKKDGTTTIHISATANAVDDLKNNKIESLCIVEETPAYITNPAMTFPEFVSVIMAQERTKKTSARHEEVPEEDVASGSEQEGKAYDIVSYSYQTSTLVLKVEDLPIASGSMVMSLRGEIAQLKRRTEARARILAGRSVNPQLGLLIEENGRIAQLSSPHKIRPLSAFVLEKVFKNPPTAKQEEAIRIALNTPDIALIQGPPGTGKTTVIAAILERLNEEADKHKIAKGRILLSGFQHDAVTNMIERLSINGLPVPKFGRRSGEESDAFISDFQRQMKKWCNDLAQRIRKKSHNFAPFEKETMLNEMCIQYTRSPSVELALKLVQKILDIGIEVLGQELFDRALKIKGRLNNERSIVNMEAPVLDLIRSLRTKVASFADDGPEHAANILDECKEYLSDDEIKIIQLAADWLPGDDLSFLPKLDEIKRSLLIRFSIPPKFTVEKHNDEILELQKEAVARIRKNALTPKDRKEGALLDFLSDLENNPQGMIDAVSDYSFAFSATCQQCVNRLMQEQKGVTGINADEKMEYDYVIIDEAARVSPRDLLIPMVQGKRIILVGDHRQLPHIIDEEVAKEMEAGETGQKEAEWLEKSMFEYLFAERLKALEEQDPDHPRRVTLDKQYRMHPVLGDFISRNFYKEEEQFGSGLTAEHFVHNLPGTDNNPAVWLEVPAGKGKHERMGTSWGRDAEAMAIANQLKEWMESPEGRDLSYGVISFYKAQADLIKKRFSTQFRDSQLRVGTVDSFQGMEFDVVFLSMVRTSNTRITIDDDDREKAARRMFGHLCLYNRLNVAMSRQKKLLVVAGDSGLLQNELAKEFVPGLVNFYDLCRKDGVILSCK